jgi:RNA polymerase sigma-70 factor (sigma-E family)
VFCASLSPRLVGSLALFCGDRHLAEELAQEALVRALERWDRVERMPAPEAWVYAVAFNLARSWFRRRGAERRAHRRLAGANMASLVLPSAERALAVRRAVDALPERQRLVVIARFYADLSVEATADVLGCAPGTVKAHTHRAIQSLRAAGLADIEEEDADAPSP